jgi:hypothetical protein
MCVSVYTIEVHGLDTRGPPTLQPQNLYVFVYNPSVFMILHYMRERNGFIEEMIREEGMAIGGIQHHNRGKLDANLRRKAGPPETL